jgi:GAF domain-containing protein
MSDSCSFCQAKAMEGAHFCAQCGAPVDGAWAGSNGEGTSFVHGLISLARGLSSTQDVDALLKRIGQSAEQMLVCEASSIMLLDDSKEHLFFKVATGEKGGVVTRYKIKLGEGVAGTVAQNRESLVLNDVTTDKRFAGRYDQISGFKTRSILCSPMIAGGELVGVLEVLNKKSGEFTEGDKGLLESLAGLGAMAIGNARIMGGFRNFYSNTIEILISAIETRDLRMAGHCFRVAQRASSLGRRIGLEGQVLKDLYYAALLHDIGFLKVSGGWNASRVLIMESPHAEQTHALIGAEMVSGISILKGASSLIALHHENYDGSGFPRGLKGDEVPIGGYILSTIENCEEMRMQGYSDEQILAALESESGKRFHPEVAAAYREVLTQETVPTK